MKKEFDKEIFFEAVKEGVKEAILTMTKSGDGFRGLPRTEEFMNAIEKGVATAIWGIATNATDMPGSDFYYHIEKGIRNAFENFNFEGLTIKKG